MLYTHFKTAQRNLLKNKWYSFINILGLSCGMGVALLTGLWIWDELSFNHYHTEHAAIAQVMDSQSNNGEITTTSAIAIPLAEELRTTCKDDFKQVALMFNPFTHSLVVGDKKISQPGVWAEPGLPELLTLKMVAGKRDVLQDPSSALIAQSVAVALFGNANPINQVVKMDNRTEFRVAGVYEDLPLNTTFTNVKLFLSWNKALPLLPWANEAQHDWNSRNWQLFVQLNEHANINKVNATIKNIVQRHVEGSNETLQLHPMDQWHLYAEFKNGKVDGGRIRLVRLFGIIGALVLLLACINFMNLSTARSAKRAKEVGIRKTIGSSRGQLIGQFLGESLLLAFLALLIAVLAVQLLLPFFNSLTDKQLVIPFAQPLFWLMILLVAMLTGLVSGSYPAFYLSAFRPVKVLKGGFRPGRFSTMPRKVLTVVQFAVSIVLIIGTVVVYQQIQHAKNRPVGYSRERLISVTMSTSDMYGAPYNGLRDALLQTGVVSDMARSSVRSTESPHSYAEFTWKGKDPNANPLIGLMGVTHDFGHTVNWLVTQGRDFSRAYATDTGSIVINEAAATLTGFKQPVGETIFFGDKPHLITGVVKDMVMGSPYTPVQPTIFYLDYSIMNALSVCFKPDVSIHEALAKIEPVFRKFNPTGVFEYKFINDEYAKKFSDEVRIGKLATVLAILAIFISCLGLLGLTSFMAEQRRKEIGVRKVLGASVTDVVGLLSKEFVILVTISLLIASPLAYYFMHNWLQQYQYRTGLHWWIFGAAGLGTLLIAFLTVSYQSIKAALMNPVNSLRAE